MPVLIKNGDEYSKVSWFTTWRVSPALRGKSIGSLLMKEALSMGKDYLIVGSSSARKVCQRFGFLEKEPLEYCYLDVSGMERLNPATWVFRLSRKLLKPLKVKVNVDNRITRGAQPDPSFAVSLCACFATGCGVSPGYSERVHRPGGQGGATGDSRAARCAEPRGFIPGCRDRQLDVEVPLGAGDRAVPHREDGLFLHRCAPGLPEHRPGDFAGPERNTGAMLSSRSLHTGKRWH